VEAGRPREPYRVDCAGLDRGPALDRHWAGRAVRAADGRTAVPNGFAELAADGTKREGFCRRRTAKLSPFPGESDWYSASAEGLHGPFRRGADGDRRGGTQGGFGRPRTRGSRRSVPRTPSRFDGTRAHVANITVLRDRIEERVVWILGNLRMRGVPKTRFLRPRALRSLA